MRMDDDWNSGQGSQATGTGGIGAVRLALLFGSAAVALGLIIAPLAERSVADYAGVPGIDLTTTGSVARSETYTLRRSVLQASPTSVCIIRANGTQAGDCK
jgi:hypothetical protein